MYTSVVNSQLQPGKREEWITILRDSIVPAAKQQSGFQGSVVLADLNSDKGLAYRGLDDRSQPEACKIRISDRQVVKEAARIPLLYLHACLPVYQPK